MNERARVWVVDDDRAIRFVLERALAQAGLDPVSFENADRALARLQHERPDVVVADVRMPGTDGLTLLERVHQRYPGLPVIIMTAYGDLDRAVAAFRGGAFEYLAKPFDLDDAVAVIRRAARGAGEPPAEGAGPEGGAAQVPGIIGSAPAMQELFRAIGRLARSSMTALITGESGTGKELVARALHEHSPRAAEAFIALNTAALPAELLESELFGHERGAFTGATAQRIGRFEQAHRGTLFLDEIGDMPAHLQTRLLRVLAEGEFYRVGGHTPVRVDVRIIAATHQDLEQRVAEGAFREDLYHRLNVIRLRVPALRERRLDIEPLAAHFLARAASALGVPPKVLTAAAVERLAAYDWPGNVRELENVCRWLTVMAPGREVHPEDLPPELQPHGAGRDGHGWQQALRAWAVEALGRGELGLIEQAVPAVERVLIEAALERTGGRRQEAARLLGWGRNTLTRKLAELGLGADKAER